jgi:ABC-type sugar transport system substrate-binding protein
MNFVCAANDIMALCASNALVSAGIKDNVILTGIDIDGGAELIKEGKQDLDVGAAIEDNSVMMDIALALAEDTWDGGDTYVLDRVLRIDATNVDAYLAGDTQACSYAIE